jgi:hypothetical protein
MLTDKATKSSPRSVAEDPPVKAKKLVQSLTICLASWRGGYQSLHVAVGFNAGNPHERVTARLAAILCAPDDSRFIGQEAMV